MSQSVSLKDLKSGSHIHLMGVCGTAMASLAGLLKDRGYKITGSDSNPYPPMSTQLESLGIQIQKPYQASNLNPRPDFVIVGNVIGAANPEAQELVKLNIPFTSLPKAIGEVIIENRESIVIAGTHGKTTTTSMMAWVCTHLKLQPGFLIGGIPKNFQNSFKNPQGNYFVIEGDEYDTAYFDKVPKFIHYKPKHVILTSIEFDHADIYKDLDDVKKSFRRLLQLTPENGHLIFHESDANIQSIRSETKAPIKTYGIGCGDYQAKILETGSDFTRFTATASGQGEGGLLGEFKIVLSGEYNVLNATSVIAMAHQLKWDLKEVAVALQSFAGVKRRQEILGEPRGVLVIEDFAHHPTAVKETIKGIKAKYPTRKIWSVFEPRSATSRRKIFQQEYVQAFLESDQSMIMQAFDQAKIDENDRFSSDELVGELKKKGAKAHVYSQVDQIVKDLAAQAQKGDLVLIMSNGGFDGIYIKILNALEGR